MLVQSVRLTFTWENSERAESILRELRDASRKEHGVIRFDVARVREEPNVFVVWEEYRDDAALDAHVATEHFSRLVLNGLKPLALELSIDVAFPIGGRSK
jgi:quinol monooxygenase YgiN